MTHSFLKILFRLLIAIVVALIAMYLFRAVLPARVAYAVGIITGVAELAGSLMTSKSGAGHGFRLLLLLGEVVLAWPIAALALQYAGLDDRPVRIGFAAAVSAAVGLLGQRHGSGRDTKRLLTVIAATAIPAYSMLVALRSGDAFALIASCVAVAVALFTVRATQVLPAGHKDATVAAVCVVAAAAALAAVRTFI